MMIKKILIFTIILSGFSFMSINSNCSEGIDAFNYTKLQNNANNYTILLSEDEEWQEDDNINQNKKKKHTSKSSLGKKHMRSNNEDEQSQSNKIEKKYNTNNNSQTQQLRTEHYSFQLNGSNINQDSQVSNNVNNYVNNNGEQQNINNDDSYLNDDNDRSLLLNCADYRNLYDNSYNNKHNEQIDYEEYINPSYNNFYHNKNNEQSEEYNLYDREIPFMYCNLTLHEILDNITANENIDNSIKQFFSDYIGDGCRIMHPIFYRDNNKQDFNDIYSILRDNRVKQYIAIGVVEDELKTTITKIYETFESTKQSEEELNLNLKIGCLNILSIEYDIIRRANKKIMNINKELYNGEIEKNIFDILIQCINNRKQYLDTRLKEITNTDNLKNICSKYIKHHNNDKQNSSDKN